MDFHSFQNNVIQWKQHLTHNEDISFTELINRSKRNERLRNLCVLYALKDEDTFYQFLLMSHEDPQVKNMLYDLHNALRIPGTRSHDVLAASRMLRHLPYYRKVGLQLDKSPPSLNASSKQIAKLFKSIIRFNNFTCMSENEKEYIEKNRKKIKLKLPKQ